MSIGASLVYESSLKANPYLMHLPPCIIPSRVQLYKWLKDLTGFALVVEDFENLTLRTIDEEQYHKEMSILPEINPATGKNFKPPVRYEDISDNNWILRLSTVDWRAPKKVWVYRPGLRNIRYDRLLEYGKFGQLWEECNDKIKEFGPDAPKLEMKLDAKYMDRFLDPDFKTRNEWSSLEATAEKLRNQ